MQTAIFVATKLDIFQRHFWTICYFEQDDRSISSHVFGSDFQPNPIPYTSPLWHLFPATLIIVWQITNSCQFQAEGKLWHCHYARASDWILRKNHLPFCCPGFISPSASLLRGVECSLYLPKAEEEKKEKKVNTTQSQVRREFTD